MTHPTAPTVPRSGLPILGQWTLLVTVAIVLDFGFHADPTVLFVTSAAAILGLAWVAGPPAARPARLIRPIPLPAA